MPRVSASNGVKPQYRALSVIKLNVPVTPAEINTAVGTGDYAAKYISFLKKDGFEFTTVKNGREVSSYTLVKEPANASTLRTSGGKPATVVSKPTKSRSNLGPVTRARPTPRKTDAFGNKVTGEVASYMVDSGFDSGPVNLRDLGLDNL